MSIITPLDAPPPSPDQAVPPPPVANPFQAMMAVPQWLVCQTVPAEPKPKKLPINYKTGSAADAHDPKIWMSYAEAYAYVQANPEYQYGFVFTEAAGFIFVDLDNCIDDAGNWSQTAKDVLAMFPGAAVEISHSGKGAHIFCRGKAPLHSCKNIPLGIELYTDKRFALITFKVVEGGDSGIDLTERLPYAVEKYFPPKVTYSTAEWTTEPDPEWDGPEDDDELLKRAFRAKASGGQVFGGKATFKQIYQGDEDALAKSFPDSGPQGRSYDTSSADAALAQHLAFWTGKNAERMDRMMQQSALVRSKWDREDYLRRTITGAISKQQNVYKQKKKPKPVVTFDEVLATLNEKCRPLVKQDFEEAVYLVASAQVEGVELDMLSDKLKQIAPEGVKAGTIKSMLSKKMQDNVKHELSAGKIYSLDDQVPMSTFPDIKFNKEGEVSGLKATLPNTKHMLSSHGIEGKYCVITKRPTVTIPGYTTGGDGDATVALETCVSQAALCGLPTTPIQNQISALCYKQHTNPVVDHLKTLSWDQSDEHGIAALERHLDVDPLSLNILPSVFRMFMIGACAAADAAATTPNTSALPKFEYVLVFRGLQGAQKTKFFRAMLPESLRQYFKDGVFLDPSDKDSVAKCTQYWISELGELDSMFKRDVARLKAFLSESQDVYRAPYARTTDTFTRRTIFVGSVNEVEFLKDKTGNRRYWPLQVKGIRMPTDDYLINQAWAEAWAAYQQGEPWWPDASLETALDRHRMLFEDSMADDPLVADVITRFGSLTTERKNHPNAKRMTAIEILRAARSERDFSGAETKKIAAWLEVNNLNTEGDPDHTSHAGQKRWLMPPPLSPQVGSPTPYPHQLSATK